MVLKSQGFRLILVGCVSMIDAVGGGQMGKSGFDQNFKPRPECLSFFLHSRELCWAIGGGAKAYSCVCS